MSGNERVRCYWSRWHAGTKSGNAWRFQTNFQLKGGDNRLEKGRTSTEIERVVYDVSKSTESAERDLGVKRRNRIKRRQKLKEKLYNINQAKKRLETPRKCSLPFRHPLICPNNIPVPFSDALFHIQGSATSKGSAHNTKEIKNVTSRCEKCTAGKQTGQRIDRWGEKNGFSFFSPIKKTSEEGKDGREGSRDRQAQS